MPASTSASSRSLPAGPMNGWPALSSLSPGCSPMNITWALEGPSPKTVWVAFLQRSQALQVLEARRRLSSVGAGGTRGAAVRVFSRVDFVGRRRAGLVFGDLIGRYSAGGYTESSFLVASASTSAFWAPPPRLSDSPLKSPFEAGRDSSVSSVSTFRFRVFFGSVGIVRPSDRERKFVCSLGWSDGGGGWRETQRVGGLSEPTDVVDGALGGRYWIRIYSKS